MARHQLVAALLICCCLLGVKGQDFTDAFNDTLQGILRFLPDPLPLPRRDLAIPLYINGLTEIDVAIHGFKLSGQSEMRAENCIYDETSSVVEMSLMLPYEAITTQSLKMVGVLLDNIDIDGEGPASFVLENLRMTIRGNTSQNNWDDPGNPIVVFTDAELELVLERWTVEMEDLTPGSDLGTLMNSFFSGLGPDIFHVLADLINQTDIVLNILNSFFPAAPLPFEENKSLRYQEDARDLVTNELVQVLTQYFQKQS